MRDWSAPLTKKEAVVIASRVVTIYFLAWLVSDLLFLPGDIYAFHYHWALATRTGSPYDAYLRIEYLRILSVHIIRVAIEFLAAGWAYRCGPNAVGYLFPESNEAAGES